MIINRTTATLLTAVLASTTLWLVGCTTPDDSQPAASSTAAAPAATAPAPETSPRPVTLPTAGVESGGDFATLQDQRDAATIAAAAMTAFSAHTLPYDQWWAGLSPYLMPEASAVWAYTDPALLAPAAPTGAPTITAAPSSTLVDVDVPTASGTWHLQVVKFIGDSEVGPWKVFTLVPPADW
ncbi:hypothetical protein [Microbacterium testaceum]|uniref:hypothetical protein n=1 Tax=Microbacterium testaceum TaxID=2033 RepID=UPI002AC5C3A7|nr:hypothetical protein [Microbacterium testaceum]MDZ5146362.1 hypothetical protein [Microbacterium testaceum]